MIRVPSFIFTLAVGRNAVEKTSVNYLRKTVRTAVRIQ